MSKIRPNKNIERDPKVTDDFYDMEDEGMDDEMEAALAKIQDALNMTSDLNMEMTSRESHSVTTETHVTMSMVETRSMTVTEERISLRHVQGTSCDTSLTATRDIT